MKKRMGMSMEKERKKNVIRHLGRDGIKEVLQQGLNTNL